VDGGKSNVAVAAATQRLAEGEDLAATGAADAKTPEEARKGDSPAKIGKLHRPPDNAEAQVAATTSDIASAQGAPAAVPVVPQPLVNAPAVPLAKPPVVEPAAARVVSTGAKTAVKKTGPLELKAVPQGAAKGATAGVEDAAKADAGSKVLGEQGSGPGAVAKPVAVGGESESFAQVLSQQGPGAAVAPLAPRAHATLAAPAAVDHDPGSAMVTGVSEYAGQRTLVATPHVLEVGLTGGAHGWLRVRAELGEAGKVTASLVASNLGSAEALNRQTGAIADFLKSAAVGVSSLVVTAAEKTASLQAAATYSDGGSARESAREQQSSGQQRSAPPAMSSQGERGIEFAGAETLPAGLIPRGLMSGASGGWLNVMA
jgi:hypothetical protein